MREIIDARGKACPIPVVETKKGLRALNPGDTMEVHVDNFIAVQNLSKMADQMKFLVKSEKINDNNYVVTINIRKVEDNSSKQENQELGEGKQGTVIAIASDKMGEGDERLGRILMKGFIYALTEQDHLPQTVLLYNSGCFLSTEDSDSVADLRLLESQGVEIITCGTCLNHYGVADQLSVGEASNMYVIVEKQMEARKVIRP